MAWWGVGILCVWGLWYAAGGPGLLGAWIHRLARGVLTVVG